MPSDNLQSLRYDKNGPSLSVLDQLLIPDEKKYIDIPDVEAAWAVIRSMQIRGAPLIAMVACLGLAVDLNTNSKTINELDGIDANSTTTERNTGDVILEYITKKMEYLGTSRPTAVNLFNALQELKDVLVKAKDNDNDNGDIGKITVRERMCQAVIKHAEFMLERDVSDNKLIGSYGAEACLRHVQQEDGKQGGGVRLVTICNTGSLATAGYGTALGVARALHEKNRLASITALETRPYNQGSRLTAFEIVEEQMPNGTLICDSAAASLMKNKGVDAVVVGADRVCANGDTANKIGTYNLAIVAAGHNVPFYVASPFTTLDVKLKSGDDITIEERPADELLQTSRAPTNINVWNPAFDVTPAKFIAGIITEKGIIEPNVDGSFNIPAFVAKHSTTPPPKPALLKKYSSLEIPINYQEQSTESLPIYLANKAPEAMEALGTTNASDLSCVEMGDGNLNLVFIVTNTTNNKRVIVKQALPYVRCVGESWPLTLDRSWYEYKALVSQKDACSEFVPAIYYFSRNNGLMVMEYIPPPNIILRKGLIKGITYPTMASDMGTFCAKTLFRTSGFKLSATDIRKQVEFWSSNSEMCALTEQVVFTEPYITAPNNRWTSPQLDLDKRAIENDTKLKLSAMKLKSKFVTQTEALIHADLHSGSVMCSPEPGQTFVIDPEFAFYGPMGFDIGAFIANLFLAYVSQDGHDNSDDYADWILQQIVIFWKTFETEFIKLWNDPMEHTGISYQRMLLEDETSVRICQRDFMIDLLDDTLGFAGMKMLRRIVGIAHVEDLESIEDADIRSKCERHGLEIAKEFIKTASSYRSIDEAIQTARDAKVLSLQ